MNTRALSTLTPADVDTLKSALRLAIRTERQTLSHERSHLPPGAIQSIETRIRSMERLADGLRPGTPPALPTPAMESLADRPDDDDDDDDDDH